MPSKCPSKVGEQPRQPSPRGTQEFTRLRAIRWANEKELRRARRLSFIKNKTKGWSIKRV